MKEKQFTSPVKMGRPKNIITHQLIALYTDIQANYASILRLYAFAIGKRTLKNKNYSLFNQRYQPTKEDKIRLPKTIAQLKQQTDAIEQQLQHLISHLLKKENTV